MKHPALLDDFSLGLYDQLQRHWPDITLNVSFPNQSPIWIRDSCTCAACVDSSTKQKNFSTTDIPVDVKLEIADIDNDKVVFRWHNDIDGFADDHTTTFTKTDFARRFINKRYGRRLKISSRDRLWHAKDLEDHGVDLTYEKYMNDERSLYDALMLLERYGILFITGVPESEESVANIAERIGPLKHTFYGRTWDVRSVPEAINVAYTSKDLGFHTDLLYMDQVPALQLLHCIRSSAKGGKSLFTDSHRAAQELMVQDKKSFSALEKINVTYHYDHPETQLYKRSRRVLASHKANNQFVSWNNLIKRVNWSPPFQAPFETYDHSGDGRNNYAKNIKEWHSAARIFNKLIHKEDGIYGRQMQPGECVIFANQRVLHARTAFEVEDAGKERWLRGAYIDPGPWESKTRVLRRRFEGPDAETVAWSK